MPQKQIGTTVIDVDDEGFMTDLSQWTKEIAEALAQEEGIAEMIPGHWKVVEYLQKEFKESGQAPTIRKINKSGVMPTKELYELFPGGPIKKAARIAGLKKPVGCV